MEGGGRERDSVITTTRACMGEQTVGEIACRMFSLTIECVFGR